MTSPTALCNNGVAERMIRALREHPAFQSLAPDLVARLASLAKIRHCRKDEHIFHEGDSPQFVYVVERGRVLVYKNLSSGKTFTFVVATRGLTLNAIACFKPRPHFFSAQATEPTTVFAVKRAEYVSWALSHPHIVVEILDAMAYLLDSAYNRMIDLVDQSVEQRVINALHMLSSRLGPRLEMTNSELADLTGASRETAARCVARLQAEGLLTKARGSIAVLDAARLAALCSAPEFAL